MKNENLNGNNVKMPNSNDINKEDSKKNNNNDIINGKGE